MSFMSLLVVSVKDLETVAGITEQLLSVIFDPTL